MLLRDRENFSPSKTSIICFLKFLQVLLGLSEVTFKKGLTYHCICCYGVMGAAVHVTGESSFLLALAFSSIQAKPACLRSKGHCCVSFQLAFSKKQLLLCPGFGVRIQELHV